MEEWKKKMSGGFSTFGETEVPFNCPSLALSKFPELEDRWVQEVCLRVPLVAGIVSWEVLVHFLSVELKGYYSSLFSTT